MNCFQSFVFLIGFAGGFFLIFTSYVSFEERSPTQRFEIPRRPLTHGMLYKLWFNSNGYKSKPVTADEISFTQHNFQLESEFLYNKVRITCVIFVTKASNTYAVKHTWGKKCNTLHFFSNDHIPYINAKRAHSSTSWGRLCKIIRNIWSIETVEWVLFAPDNIFVIPENLRYFVAYRDPERPYYFGHTVHFWNKLYNSGKTAYVLSRGAIRKFISKFHSTEECLKNDQYTNNEDFVLGKYLHELGIKPEDTRDEKGRQRFHLFTPAQLFAPGNIEVLEKYSRTSFYPVVQGTNCCSPSTISMKGTQIDWIFYYSYLLYNVNIFTSGNLGNKLSNLKAKSLEAAERFISETLGKGVNLGSISSDKYYELWLLKIKTPEEFNEQIKNNILLEKHDFFKNLTRDLEVTNNITSH